MPIEGVSGTPELPSVIFASDVTFGSNSGDLGCRANSAWNEHFIGLDVYSGS